MLQSKLSELIRTHWLAFLLPIPWIAVIVWFEGLARPVPTFHDGDELIYHYPIIQQFAKQLPFVDLSDYASATTPGFHLLFAVCHRWLQLELPQLRLLNASISVLGVLLLYTLLVRYAYQPRQAFLLALMFGLSPYYFGASFRLLTDNLALTLVIASLLTLHEITLRWNALTNGLMYLLIGSAIFTRQLSAWLLLAASTPVLSREQMAFEPKRILATILLALIALLPTATLFAYWGGFTTPYFRESHGSATALTVAKNLVFCISLFGAYSTLLAPIQATSTVRSILKSRQGWATLTSIAAATTLVLLLFPCAPGKGDDGIWWRVAGILPQVGGSSLLFWLTLPVGMVLLAKMVFGKCLSSFQKSLVIGLMVFLLVNAANGKVFQKYYDTYLLVFIMLLMPVGKDRYSQIATIAFAISGIAYFLMKVAGS